MEKYLPRIIGSFINVISYFSKNYAAKLAIKLFSKPRKGRLTAAEAQYLNGAVQKEIILGTISIKTYQWKGAGKTMLLTHGWESNSFRWKTLLEYFKDEDYNIIALDAPAHGGSSGKEFNAPVYSECIAAAVNQYKPEVIIGHSVGGMASVFSLKNHKLPSVKHIILLGAPDAFENILKNYENMMGYNNRVKSAIRHYVANRFKFTTKAFATSRFVDNLNIKCLIIHDEKDRVIPFSDAKAIHNSFKNSTLTATKGFGHGLKHKEVYKHISHFLKA